MQTSTITKGMANAITKEKTTCPSCSLKIPKYSGRYPSKCPNCGNAISTNSTKNKAELLSSMLALALEADAKQWQYTVQMEGRGMPSIRNSGGRKILGKGVVAAKSYKEAVIAAKADFAEKENKHAAKDRWWKDPSIELLLRPIKK